MTSAQETIAELIDLAQQGEIDPWDVQVIDVIDRYLSELAFQSDPDLSESGQAFLWASMLVLLKAETLEAEEVPEELPPPEEVDLDFSRHYSPQYLERHIRLRAVPPTLQKRPVTLQDLIVQLQEIQAEMDTKIPVPRRRPPTKGTLKAALELAHQENLTETAIALEALLQSWWRSHPDQEFINLDDLVQLWREHQLEISLGNSSNSGNHTPHTSENSDRVAIFWALLLLTSQSQVELSQADFYQELQIRPCSLPIPHEKSVEHLQVAP
ncbi:MAG: segregation/condensation protein A [Coleofasciculaceae cyanobacterium SM2_1_6]|nr:segregation/condensation protein A [Coleofasciculaceae cyanobacterium SM2_1_6]